jgi:hypothetical protein
MINEIYVYKMIQLKNDLINFKDYYIKNKNKNKTDQDIKGELSNINENSWINVNNCIIYYKSLPGKIYLHNSGGFFYTKKKILIQPIINDLIGKLDLIIKQHNLINQKINEMNSSSLDKKGYEQLIKIKTFDLLVLCKEYISELLNLNIKIYQKKNYGDIEQNNSYISLKLTINKINIALTESINQSIQKPSRTAQLPLRAVPTSSSSSSSSSLINKNYDSDVVREYKELKKEMELIVDGTQGGRIKRVKKENKKMNEKVAKKKITTNKIK